MFGFLWYVGRMRQGQRSCFGFLSWRAKFLEKADMNKVTAFHSTLREFCKTKQMI